jgi:hypothetical protein
MTLSAHQSIAVRRALTRAAGRGGSARKPRLGLRGGGKRGGRELPAARPDRHADGGELRSVAHRRTLDPHSNPIGRGLLAMLGTAIAALIFGFAVLWAVRHASGVSR